MANINFKNAVNKILSTSLNMALTKNGMDLINKILDYLNSRLVSSCVENTDVTTARNAVDGLFSGNLKRLALAEGNRILMLYSNGLIEYKAHYSVKTKKKTKKQLVVAALEFSDGISRLASFTFAKASLQEQAKKILCELLEEIAVKISGYIQSRKKDIITVQDIRSALKHLFPPELLKHALAEGARIAMLFETGLLEETIRREAIEKPKRIAASEKVAKVQRKKRSVSRKRKQSPSVESPPRKKRRRRSSARKISKKKTRRIPTKSKRKRTPRKVSKGEKKVEIRKRRVTPKRKRSPSVESRSKSKKRRKSSTRKVSTRKISSRRSVSRKRAPSRKVVRKKRVQRKTVPKAAVRRKVSKKRATKRTPSRKRRVSRKAARKVSKKRKIKTARSQKKRTPSRKTTVRKKTKEVSPKTVRRQREKKHEETKIVSKKVISPGIAVTTIKEIERGTRKLNETRRQKLAVESARTATELLCILLEELIKEIGKIKSSVIGPEEVRRAVLKAFPPNLAQLANAHMSRVLMT